ncbi:hypothetical protein FRC01_012591, partial [Tulasnella sp. 417]
VKLASRKDREGTDAQTPEDTKTSSNNPTTKSRFGPLSLLSRILPRRSNSDNTSPKNEAAKSRDSRPLSGCSQASSSLSEYDYLFFAPATPEMIGLTAYREITGSAVNTGENKSNASPAGPLQPPASIHPLHPPIEESSKAVGLVEVAEAMPIRPPTPASFSSSITYEEEHQDTVKVGLSTEVGVIGDQESTRSALPNPASKARRTQVEVGYVSESSRGTSTESLYTPVHHPVSISRGPQRRHHIVIPSAQPLRPATPVSVSENDGRDVRDYLEHPTATGSQSQASDQDTRMIQPGTVVVRTPSALVHSTLSRPMAIAELEEELRWYAMFNCRQFYFMKVQAARARGYEVGPNHTLRPISNPASPANFQANE